MNVIQSIDLITKNPSVRGGKPCIAGTGLRVTDLVIAHLFHIIAHLLISPPTLIFPLLKFMLR